MTVKTVCDNCTKDMERNNGIEVKLVNKSIVDNGINLKDCFDICESCITTEDESGNIGETISNALIEFYIHRNKKK